MNSRRWAFVPMFPVHVLAFILLLIEWFLPGAIRVTYIGALVTLGALLRHGGVLLRSLDPRYTPGVLRRLPPYGLGHSGAPRGPQPARSLGGLWGYRASTDASARRRILWRCKEYSM